MRWPDGWHAAYTCALYHCPSATPHYSCFLLLFPIVSSRTFIVKWFNMPIPRARARARARVQPLVSDPGDGIGNGSNKIMQGSVLVFV